jgi:hypothetical protein
MRLKLWFQNLLSRTRLSHKSAPIALLAIMALTFGLFIPVLGFYWDDWTIVFLGRTHGNFWQFYQSDRPFMAWLDILFLAIAGENPVAWQIASLLVRSATVLGFWWCLTLIWPKATRQVLDAALLFAIYPVFVQQPMAITYKSIFSAYLLYFVSLGLMLLAFRKPYWFYPLTILSLLTGAAHLLTMEYFWGLELLRPILIWMIISEKTDILRCRIKKLLLNWLPYLLLFGCVVIWRFYFLNLVDDRNTPILLLQLFHSPGTAFGKLSLMVWSDALFIVVSNWLAMVQPEMLSAGSPILLKSWVFVILISVFVGSYLFSISHNAPFEERKPSAWTRQAIWVGLIAFLVGMIPVWMTGRQASVGNYSDRFAIPAMIGASLLVSGLLYVLISKWWHRVIILAILIGLSAGFHIRISNEYRWDWTYQERFYWQLYWRAPALKPHTAFLSEAGIFKWVTKYSLAAAINTLYPVPNGTTNLPYWVFELDNLYTPDQLMEGIDLSAGLRTLTFNAPSHNSLVISYDPYNRYSSTAHCLWMLSAEDAYAPGLGPLTLETLPLSNLGQILPVPSASNYPDGSTFGAEPDHTWCYYFEKADLARQYGDWETIRDLGNEAQSLSHRPNDPYEWLPFIEGYIHVRDWEKARELTLEVYDQNPNLLLAVCSAWTRSTVMMTISPSESEIVSSINKEIGCPSP